MSNIIINTYTQYQQSEAEKITGTLLNTEQKKFIQNQIAMIADQRLALVPDPNNYASFIQQEGYLKGQMDAYKYLIDCSEIAENINVTPSE